MYIYSDTGAWSYDDSSKELILVIEHEEGDNSYSDFRIYTAEMVNGQLVLSTEGSDYYGDYSSTIYLNKK